MTNPPRTPSDRSPKSPTCYPTSPAGPKAYACSSGGQTVARHHPETPHRRRPTRTGLQLRAAGWRYEAFATNHNIPVTPDETPQQVTAWLDGRHRVHARVEDHFKDGNTTGAKRLPSKKFAVNAAWYRTQAIATDLIAWLQLLACHGHLARAEPEPCNTRYSTPRPPSPEAADDGG